MGNDKTLAFFRHAEIKHGRVAMAGIVGLLFHINHIHFSGYLSPTFGVSFVAQRSGLASARGDFRERRALGGRGVSREALMESAASSREAVAAAGVQSTASSDSV